MKIKLISWRPTVHVVSLIEFVRSQKGVSLREAKQEVESFLDGKPLVLIVEPSESTKVQQELELLGVEIFFE